MEPLSIIAAVGSLTTLAAKTAVGCNSLISKYEDAPRALALIESECKILKDALSFVTEFVMTNASTLMPRLSGPRNVLSNLVDDALTGSTVVFGMLDSEISKLMEHAKKSGDFGWKTRIQAVWNEAEMNTLLTSMRDVKSTVQLLLTALQA